jgi:HK97 family phage major capsid protein
MSSSQIQTLIDKRAKAWTAATAILDTAEEANRELDAEERSAYDKATEEVDTLTEDIDRFEAPAASGTGSAGGYLVPQGFRAQIVQSMLAYGHVRDAATVLTTETGNPLPWPTNNDTGNTGALLAENTQIAEQDVTLGQAQLNAYKYTSKLIRVSFEFLQDTIWMDAEAWLSARFAERLGRIENAHLTTGSGSSQPNGIVTGSVSGVTAASATTFTADELIDLIHSVDPAYRNSNSKFMLSDTALKVARKFKDNQNRYLWEPSLQNGVASTLFGSEYIINPQMPALTTGLKPILYGDFKAGYVVRVVREMQMVRLVERYADYLQVGFFAYERIDGQVQDTGAYKALTLA